MTPQLPPVLPGFSEPIRGPLAIITTETESIFDVASADPGDDEWVRGWTGLLDNTWFSLRLGSPIALANGIGVVPEGLPPLPPVPDGYDRWEYRGTCWITKNPAMYSAASTSFREDGWHDPLFWEEVEGSKYYHYIEAVKEPLPAAPVGEQSPTKISAEGFRQHLGAMLEKAKPEAGDGEMERLRQETDEILEELKLEDRIAELESDLAAARAIFPKICEAIGNGACCTPDASIEFLSEIPNEVRLEIEKKDRELKRLNGTIAGMNEVHSSLVDDWQRLRAALEDMEKKATWNRQIRDSLVKLFKDDGWQDDCTLINELTNMNFDALAPASENSTPAPDWWRPIETAPKDKPFIGLMEDGLVFRTKFQLSRTYPTKEEAEEHGWRGFHPTRMKEGWSYEDGDSLSPCNPVGWMPLPTAPDSSGKGEA